LPTLTAATPITNPGVTDGRTFDESPIVHSLHIIIDEYIPFVHQLRLVHVNVVFVSLLLGQDFEIDVGIVVHIVHGKRALDHGQTPPTADLAATRVHLILRA